MPELDELQELIADLSPESHTLFAEAVLGRDAVDFFTSELGRCMVGFAKQDLDEALQKLRKTSPWRWRRIQQLQNEVELAERFLLYVRDLIIRGIGAEKTLAEREDD